jgi:hypothetical protein
MLYGNEKGGGAPDVRLTDLYSGTDPKHRGKSEPPWLRSLVDQADRLLLNRLVLFGQEHYLGAPPDWNCDHEIGKRAPLGFAGSIDYRDFDLTGDAKLVWEPNRHHQFVILGRAYQATGQIRYARAATYQMDRWVQACPFGRGMNWRSPLELAIRLINWVWTLDLIRESGVFSGDVRTRLLHTIYLHLWEITRKYSRGSSANNHIIGEAAGVFIATSYFREFQNATRWRKESQRILSEQIVAQTYPDGCSREHAFGYHLFALQFFLLAALIGRRTGEDFGAPYWSRLEKMLEFEGAMTEGGEEVPMVGDCDDGYVLDLGGAPGDPRSALSVGAIIYNRGDFKRLAGGLAEPAHWLLGHSAPQQFAAIVPDPSDDHLLSRAFPESGYYLLQCGPRAGAGRISVLFDCGALGFKSIAAHGHADALSFTLRAFGHDVFVDPGTYDYFAHPEWRTYFRSTRAHNTVGIDGLDQSVMLGPFMWGDRAHARCLQWEPRGQGGFVYGEHDGYTRLKDPVRHQRALDLDAKSRTLSISDTLVMQGEHEIAVYFHLAEDCRVAQVRPDTFQIRSTGGEVTLSLDSRFRVDLLNGAEDPIGGWVSRKYHVKVPATTIVARVRCEGNTAFTSRVYVGTA